jgi:hypothetical protein
VQAKLSLTEKSRFFPFKFWQTGLGTAVANAAAAFAKFCSQKEVLDVPGSHA